LSFQFSYSWSFQNSWSLVFWMHPKNPNLISVLGQKNLLMGLIQLCFEALDPSCFKFLPKTLTSFLNWKNFLKESLITLYLFNSLMLDHFQNSRSFVSQMFSHNPNFTFILKSFFKGEFDCVPSFKFSYSYPLWSSKSLLSKILS
jgi:hypothetical protein